MDLPRLRPLRLLALAGLTLALISPVPASAATPSTSLTRWASASGFATGTSAGLKATSGAVTLGAGTTRVSYDDPRVTGGAKKFDLGSWTSPWRSTGFAAKSLIPSWSASTPGGSWIRVHVRVRSGSQTGSWDSVARWGIYTSHIRRTSYSSQTDDLARLATDTIVSNSGKSFTAWQVKVELLRPAGTTATPTLRAVNAVAASYTTRSATTSRTTMTATKDLAVPPYSQMIHRGQFPQWGGGGEAWCSPTSISMVLRYFKKGPSPAAYAWVPYADPFVDHAARYTFDEAYDGTGNWSFNTAYAAHYSLDAFVTRLHDLRDVEAFVKAGIPLVASVAYPKGGLTGAPISSTPGHLLVVRGFTSTGKVIVNDPAAPKNSTVKRTYSRAQFEKAWLNGSGGVVYVARPATRALPRDTARW